jgi:peptide-methionine (R)-S-oxide reductase
VAKVTKTDAEWREQLSPEQYAVLRRAGTERAGSGEYASSKGNGVYHCAGCGAPLFRSDTKYESGTGWPSFWEPVAPGALAERSDTELGMARTEVLCAACDGHLGHVFPDGPPPTGRRYCMNSLALKLECSGDAAKK